MVISLIFAIATLSATPVSEFVPLPHVSPKPLVLTPKADPPLKLTNYNWVDSVLNKMSLEEQIGQLFMVAAYSNRPKAHEDSLVKLIKKHHIGGLIFFQGNPVAQAKLTNKYQKNADVPLMIAMDAEWGLGMRLDKTIDYPYQMTLGAIQEDSLLYELGSEVARQFKRIGMHVNFAPVVDVNNNPNNPVINFRSFGEDVNNVSNKGVAYMKGMQENGILANAKHFPGHGDTDVDSHKSLPVINHSKQRLDSVEFYPFKRLIHAGVGSMMVAHMSIPSLDSTENLPSTLSKPIVTDLLKKDMDFSGLVFTDALNMKGVSKFYEPGVVDVKALVAGNDVLLFSEDIPIAVKEIKKAIKKGLISKADLKSRCRKILAAKYKYGLHKEKLVATQSLVSDLNNPKAQLLKRQLTEASLTVLKNENNILPLRKLDTLKVASVSIGAKSISKFQKTLGRYTKVDHFTLPKDATDSKINFVKEQLKRYNLVIVGMHQVRRIPSNNKAYSKGLIEFVQNISQDQNAVLVCMRNPYTLSQFPNIENSKAIVLTYQDDPDSQSLSAQLIFGAINGTGRLPVSIDGRFSANSGIDIAGIGRFKYTLPYEVGMNRWYLEHKIDSIAKLGIDEGAFPGCQVLVAKAGNVVFHKTYGYHTYDNKRKVRADDIYDLASITKIAGPLPALMKLYDEEKFDLDAGLVKYWPDFKNSNKEDITYREALAHNGGLKAWIAYWENTVKKNGKFKGNTFKNKPSKNYIYPVAKDIYLHKNYRKKIFKEIKESPLRPQKNYMYSGLASYLYPTIIENLTGSEYEQYLKKTFYEPLGAHTVTFNAYKHFPLDKVVPTEKDNFFRNQLLHGYVHDEGAAMMGGVSGNAGLFGKADDLAKIMQMYMQKGEYAGDRYLLSSTLDEFTKCQYCETENRRGLGFDKPFLNREEGHTAIEASDNSFGHAGYTGTFTWADPDNDLLFIFLSNRVYPTRKNGKLYEYNIRPAMHQVIYDALKVGKRRDVAMH